MPYRIDIYIGSDNGSRRIDGQYLGKVRQWADANFPDGYTLMRGKGYYRGISEDSLVVNVLSDCDLPLRDQLDWLKHSLCQEAILLVKSDVELEII